MKPLKRYWVEAVMIAAAGWLLVACAVLQPDDKVRAQYRDPKFAKSGDMVVLSYSGNLKEEFCPGNIVTVYRPAENGPGEIYHSRWNVGQIQVLGNLSNGQVEAKMLEGAIMPGDMALQPGGKCTVQASMLR